MDKPTKWTLDPALYPTEEMRLMHYRSAALSGLLATSTQSSRGPEWGKAYAALAEHAAQAMLAAETPRR